MPTEHTQSDHASIRRLIDQSLAGAASAQEPQAQQALREHLSTCAACRQHLDLSNRAIAGLGDFSFPLDPGLDSKVLAAVAARAQQLEAAHLQRKRLWTTSCLALVLTIIGSFAATQLGSLAAPVFHFQPAQLHLGLAAFWIAPSVCFCLLFLLLPMSARFSRKKGLSL
jgi:predicted anti-sigma-YlaC factor YlaD